MKSIDYLKRKGVEYREIHLAEVPKSAQDVERLFGCPLHQVLKSLLFMAKKPILVVVPGDTRVDKEKVKQVANEESLRMAKPDEVQEATGYSIGGVTPFGIENDILMIIDESVFEMEKVNIGSGKAEIGIELKSSDLRSIWNGKVADIVQNH